MLMIGKGRIKMREILFRGKRVDNGEWVYGYYTKHISGKIFIRCVGKDCTQSYEVFSDSVGEFTGLYDTKNRKLFEGDIVKDIESEIGVVTYGEFNCSCCYGVYGWTIDYGDIREDVTIIGNIYENVEIMLKHIDNQVFAYKNLPYYKERARNFLQKHKDKFPEELINEYLKRWE